MESIKFIHTADIHQEGNRIVRIRKSWDSIIKHANDVDIALIAGDFWNSPQELSDDSAVNVAIEMLQELASHCPVIIIRGNRQHDEYGSLKILGRIKSRYPIQVCESVNTYGFCKYMHNEKRVFHQYPFEEKPNLIIHCFSYPEKGNFLRDKKDMGIDEANQAIYKEIGDIFLGFAAIKTQYLDVPSITMFHGHVVGAKISSGQVLVSQDISIPDTMLMMAASNYYALGHIHEWQDIQPNMYYSGSTDHKDFGEINPKKFIIGEFQGKALALEHITIDSIPLSLHEAWYDEELAAIRDDELENEDIPKPDWINAILRVRLTCTKVQRLIATDEAIKKMYPDALEYKIEYIQSNEERKRSDEISSVKRLRDKILVYAKAKNQEIEKQVIEFADQTEAETEIE